MEQVEIETVELSAAELQRSSGQPVQLPECYNEYAMFAGYLGTLGVWDWLKTRVLARRAGAYEVCDLVLFLLCLFSAGSAGESIGDFAQRSRIYGAELAGIMDRLRWMAQGSVSRALASVDLGLAREISRRLLLMSSIAAGRSRLVKGTGYRDGRGDSWEVFHWDTTITALRERALPEDGELPEPIRLARQMAAPGYTGRKRGEVQISRSVVCEATTGVWIEVDVQAGNGDHHEQMRQAAEGTLAYLEDDKSRRERAVVVSDGVGGGTIQAVALRESGLMFLTRSSAYHLLEDPPVMLALEKGPWTAVEDSLSGPRREAMELGTHQVGGSVACRMIVSRFPTGGKKKRGAGKAVGAWQYELYITDLPEERWAAADAVTLYYGRNALENRLAAEDRDFGLDRVFSYNAPGQALASAVALIVWNLRLVLGLSLMPPGLPPRVGRPRPSTPPVEAEPAHDESAPTEAPVEPAKPLRAESDTRQALGSREDEASSCTTSGRPHEPDATCSPVSPPPLGCEPPTDRAALMEQFCQDHPGWTSSPDVPALVCPRSQPLRLSAIRHSGGPAILRFRARTGICDACPMRRQCAPTAKAPHFRREATLALPVATRGVEAEAFELARAREPDALNTPLIFWAPNIVLPATPAAPPPLLPATPILLPARVRRATRDMIAKASILVLVVALDSAQRKACHLALQNAERQRRRLTRAQRVALNERPNADQTSITIKGPSAFGEWVTGSLRFDARRSG